MIKQIDKSIVHILILLDKWKDKQKEAKSEVEYKVYKNNIKDLKVLLKDIKDE